MKKGEIEIKTGDAVIDLQVLDTQKPVQVQVDHHSIALTNALRAFSILFFVLLLGSVFLYLTNTGFQNAGFPVINVFLLAILVLIVIFVLLIVMYWLARKTVVHVSDLSFSSGSETDSETKAVLEVVNELLEKLPEKEVERFLQSKDFELYKKVLEKYGIEE